MGDIEEVFASFLAAEAVEGEEALLYLTRRCKGLAVSACAHAVFFCRLLQAFR